MFYNPLTKKKMISNTAEFDERAFPGLSRQSPPSLPSEPELRIIEPGRRRMSEESPEQVGDMTEGVGVPEEVEDVLPPPQEPPSPPRAESPPPPHNELIELSDDESNPSSHSSPPSSPPR